MGITRANLVDDRRAVIRCGETRFRRGVYISLGYIGICIRGKVLPLVFFNAADAGGIHFAPLNSPGIYIYDSVYRQLRMRECIIRENNFPRSIG